jgi:hypothetical protein
VQLARANGVAPHDGGTHVGDDSVLLLTSGERIVGKVVLLTFDATGSPALAIKTARSADSAVGLQREAAMLEAVRALAPRGVPGVPHVLFQAEAAGQPVVGESALPGVPLAALLRRDDYPRIAERVTAWLCTLAEPALESEREPAWDRVIAPALARFTSEFGRVVDPERLRSTNELLRSLGSLPVVCEQRDFSPWNVFEGESGQGIVVLDWESGEARGIPALDLIYFATHAAFYLERAWITGKVAAAHRAAWSRDTEMGRVNHACAARYLERLGLREEFLAPLRMLAWVLHSHSDYVHMCADTGGPPDSDQLRRSRFLQLFDVELEWRDQC